MTPRWHWLLLGIVYLVIAVILYSPSLGGPWQYDDYAQILDTKVLTARSIPTLLGSVFRFTAWPDGWTGTRDIVRATFRLNFDWWGLSPAGYRWVNLGIHVVTALLVAVLIYIFYNSYNSYNRYNNYIFYISALAGLLFLIHPIQSQAVAYVAQRFASMATMFYVATVVFFLLFLRERCYKRYKSYIFYGISLLSALLALNSKEISMTLPVALVLVLIGIRHKAEGIRKKEEGRKLNAKSIKFLLPFTFYLLPFFLLALKVPLQIMTASARGSAETASPVPTKLEFGALAMQQEKPLTSRKEYFLTELNVVRTYLRLLVLPIGQTLDWDYPITHSMDVPAALSALLHAGLIGAGIWLLLRASSTPSRMVGLGILWFYLTIALESSVIPIPDVMYEHRVYLPFVGVAIAFSGIAYSLYNRYKNYKSYMAAIFAAWLLLLAGATVRRAWVWGDEVRLWADVYQKAPNKARANKNYGVVLAARGQYQQGITRLKRALELEPENADYWSNLGTAYLRSGDFKNSAPQFLKAFELSQEKSRQTGKLLSKTEAQYINDYGVSLVQLGKGEDAEKAFRQALEIEPTLYAAWLGLGAAKNIQGDVKGAIEIFTKTIQNDPKQPDAYGNLATMLIKAKRYDEAMKVLLLLKKINPTYQGIDERIGTLKKALMDKPAILDTMSIEGSNP